MAVAVDVAELLEHLARLGVGQEEVDPEEVALGEEGDVAAVRADGGRDVHVAAVELAGEDAAALAAAGG